MLHVKCMMSTPIVNPEVNDKPENVQEDNIYKQRKHRVENTPDFSSLLNNQDNDMFNEDFYNECINRKKDKEKNMQEYNYTSNNSLKVTHLLS